MDADKRLRESSDRPPRDQSIKRTDALPLAESGAAAEVARLIEQGVARRRAGDLQAAAELYRQAAGLPGAPVQAFFNWGNALHDLGRFEEAKGAFESALERDGGFLPARMQLARCLARLEHLDLARGHFEAVVQGEPGNFSAWLELGHVLRRQTAYEPMSAAYRQAMAVAPVRWEPLLSMARGLEEAGQWDMAAIAYHRAVLVGGATAQQAAGQGQADGTRSSQVPRLIHWRMARFRLERGDAARALEAIRQALMAQRIERQHHAIEVNELAEMQIDLAEILLRLGMDSEAHRAFERASAATAESTLARLAETSFRFNLWQEAQQVLKRAVDLYPGSAMSHWNLAHAYAESWQLEEALATLARAEALAPQPGAKSMRASIAGRLGDADTALTLYSELARAEGKGSRMSSSAAMSSLYSDRLSAEQVAQQHRELFSAWGEGARALTSFPNGRDPDRPLRVGLVTADFHHQHPVNIFMQPILPRLDPAQLQLTVYFTGVSYDDQTRLAQKRVAHWVECSTLSDAQLAQRIARDQIDVLIDLAGHTSLNRMAMFAQRAAPVQMSYLGYPGSTGVPHIDWLLADEVVAPKGSEALFSEKLIRLPGTVFCYHPEVDYPFPEYGQAQQTRILTFGSFNNAPKLTPRTIALWARVLQAVPDSRLLLKAPSFKDAGAVASFQRRFASHGIDASRLEFRGPVGLSDMMAEYADIDIALDPVPYNGGTTTLQALWMGVPVVVRAGSHFVSRMGASFMTALGLPDWVAQDDEAYVRIAAAMASDRAALLGLKRGLRERQLKAAAWNIDSHAQAVQDAIRCAWQRFCGL
jgi:predicted O-linked N-acetylglucosamine transferase (SPINDLY family)